MTANTTRLGLQYVQGTDNINTYPTTAQQFANTIDGIWMNEALDFLSPGVAGKAAALNTSGPTINSGSGLLTIALNFDFAWVLVNGVMTRCVLPTAPVTITPSGLPSSGNYACVGIYVAPSATWSTAGTLSTATGSATNSAFNALALHSPATPNNTLLLQYVVILNTGGVYSIALTSDARSYLLPGSVSGTAYGTYSGTDYTSTTNALTPIDSVNLSVTLPITTGAIEASFQFDAYNVTSGTMVVDVAYTFGGAANQSIALVGGNVISGFRFTGLTNNVANNQQVVMRYTSGLRGPGAYTFYPRFACVTGNAVGINNGGGIGSALACFWVKQIGSAV